MKRQKNKQAKFAFQQDKSLMIPTESYNKLDQKSKSIWRTLPDDLKRTLLNINQPYKSNVHKSYNANHHDINNNIIINGKTLVRAHEDDYNAQ